LATVSGKTYLKLKHKHTIYSMMPYYFHVKAIAFEIVNM